MSNNKLLLCNLAIQIQGMTIVVARGTTYNTNGDDQVLHQRLEFDNFKVCIIDPPDINACLLYPIDEVITVGDAIDFFIA